MKKITNYLFRAMSVVGIVALVVSGFLPFEEKVVLVVLLQLYYMLEIASINFKIKSTLEFVLKDMPFWKVLSVVILLYMLPVVSAIGVTVAILVGSVLQYHIVKAIGFVVSGASTMVFVEYYNKKCMQVKLVCK